MFVVRVEEEGVIQSLHIHTLHHLLRLLAVCWLVSRSATPLFFLRIVFRIPEDLS